MVENKIEDSDSTEYDVLSDPGFKAQCELDQIKYESAKKTDVSMTVIPDAIEGCLSYNDALSELNRLTGLLLQHANGFGTLSNQLLFTQRLAGVESIVRLLRQYEENIG